MGSAALIDGITTGCWLVIPVVSASEAAQLEKRSRVHVSGGLLTWFQRVLADPSFALAAFDPVIAINSVASDWAHKDPADRIIVATARYPGVSLLTADRTILNYAKTGQFDAIDARL